MKSRKLITKYVVMAIIGGALAWFNVFAPLHEIWHFWFSSFSGGDPIITWNATYIERGTANTIMALSGFYGEILLEAALSLYFLNRAKFGLSGLFMGVMVSTTFYAPMSSDFAKYEHYIWGLYTSWWIFVSVAIVFVLIITMITFSNMPKNQKSTSKIPGQKSKIR